VDGLRSYDELECNDPLTQRQLIHEPSCGERH
jgi:hypothetical protein